MSTVLEVAGLTVLAVGVFLLLGLGLGLVVLGVLLFAYAQTVSDSAIVAAWHRLRQRRTKVAVPTEVATPPVMTRRLFDPSPPWPSADQPAS